MENLPQQWLSINVAFGGGPQLGGGGCGKDQKMASAEHLVLDLSNPDLRDNSLLELSKSAPNPPNYARNNKFLSALEEELTRKLKETRMNLQQNKEEMENTEQLGQAS